jgi:hypothetical protein
MTTAAPEQLAFPTDARADDLHPDAIAGVEAKVQHDDATRDRHASPAPACACPNPWGDLRDRRCCRCGRTVKDSRKAPAP